MSALLLVGATGLVGRCVLAKALADARVTSVTALTRKPLAPHPKLSNPIVNFDSLDPAAPYWKSDAVICTLGTTIGSAGSRDAFRKVDHDYPLAVARVARSAGVRAFALNSSVGADAKSGTFYLRVKGELEDALANLKFPSLTLVRPSLLSGARTEFRLGERLMLIVNAVLKPLIPRRYRAVSADLVAAALIEAALSSRPGISKIESDALQKD